ncbi:hypothetical protein GOV06_01935 [Candidatus Woesearchaeota archaeon]|nr:hypothetical protein [Candidatus Woesearchaeota archaeon]
MEIREKEIRGDGFDENCEFLLNRHEGSIDALIKYGSTVYGKPTADSLSDFFVVVDSVRKFHKGNRERYSEEYGGLRFFMKRPLFHIVLNHLGPNFYQINEDGHDIKEGVISLNSFVRFCNKFTMYTAGRMQKAVDFAYFRNEDIEDKVKKAVDVARRRGMEKAINLCDKGFNFNEFATYLVGLSYMADFRPGLENPNKVNHIVNASIDVLKDMYVPLLDDNPRLDKVGERYVRKDKKGQKATKLYLFLNKFPFTFLNIKNAFTNSKAGAYVKRKRQRNTEGKKESARIGQASQKGF